MILPPNWYHDMTDSGQDTPEQGPYAEWWASEKHLAETTTFRGRYYIIRLLDDGAPYNIYKAHTYQHQEEHPSTDWLIEGYQLISSFHTLEAAIAAYLIILSTI